MSTELKVNINLSKSQQETAQKIADYGAENGFSDSEVATAVKTAFIESSLGDNMGPPPPEPGNPNPTASGLYQYTDGSWDTYHDGIGEKDNIDNQIEAFYDDMSTYRDWYTNPDTNGNIPRDEIDFGEYVYTKHHDGRSYDDFLNAPGLLIWNQTEFTPSVTITYDECVEEDPNGVCSLPIDDGVGDFFDSAQSAVQRRDPLTLDLDGDGLETVGIDPANPILFDHDADGIKTATGWIKPDDAFLVLDRNGNGTIDDGTELFGDSTPLYDSEGNVVGTAEDGFAALAEEDTNGDGVVDANDANFANLRIWRDLNSDGVSQDGELQSLEEAGITAINVAKIENSQPLPDGNLLADLGSYVRSDGSSGEVGNVSAEMGDIDLIEDTFHSEFADSIPLTPETETLPNMNGSGRVRDLQEAASLSPALASLLAQYAQADTRAAQLSLLDQLIVEWGKTSDLAVTGDGAYDGAETTVSIAGYAQGSAGYDAWMAELQTLERFNGRPFGTPPAGAESVFVNLFNARQSFLNQAYNTLKQSVYDGLLIQTRLKPYVDSVGVSVVKSGFVFDFSAMGAAFQTRFEEAPAEAVRDLLDLQRVVGTDMTGKGWGGYGQLRGWLAGATADTADPALVPSLIAALGDFGYPGLATSGDGSNASEAVIGDDAGDVLNGQGGNDLVLGSDGDDTLNGGSGNDVLYGGDGNDTYVFNAGDGADTIVEAHGDTGTDTLQFGPGILAGDLDIYAEGDKLVFKHTNGRDSVSIANWFGSLNDDAHRLDTLNFSDGKSLDLNTLQLGGDEADTLTGTEANDILVGGAGDDILTGEAGDDLLYGGTGNDTMAGGIGNDTYVVDSAGDTVSEAVGEGVDTVEARVSHTLSDNVENLTLAGTGSISGTGNSMDNIITGNSGSNSLYGMDGDDTISGGAGNDILDGGTGADVMAGGTGDDRYVVDTLADTVVEYANQGTDTVNTHLDYTLGDNVENLNLTGTEAVSGTGNELNNVLTGNTADNTLTGLAGNDTLDGGLGADTMLGGTGDDTYVVDNAGDLVVENVNEGTDTVESSITYTLTDNVENLTLTGSEAIDGTGNELDNVIIGNSADNTLTGLAGNDTLDGQGGADTMQGNTGDDTYVVDNVGDAVTENLGEGMDTVKSSIAYTLGDNVENLTLTGGANINGTGNELDNTLVGNYRNNVLDGGLGADSMAGGRGNDTYILDNTGDSVSEAWSQGVDTVISPFDYTLGDNVENLTLTGEALTGTGNTLNNVIIGTGADNTLTGLDGNDTLDGGAGGDTLVGGRGNDTYVVDDLADTTIEGVNEGVDTVHSNLTWTLADNLDNLTLTGTEAIDGTGNELDNVIIGNSAANTLTGLAGNDRLDGGGDADTMYGGTGDDTYVVDNAGDAVIENGAEGTDTVESSITYTLTDNVENLTLTGSDAIDGTGNELDNVIKGNSAANTLTALEGNDTLDGGRGADTMAGGTGDDTYIVDNSADIVVEGADEGTDHVQASASYTLSDNVENLTLTGSGNISGTGNTQDNTIIGNSGANTLVGGTGADTMAGGGGNDTYVVDNGGDLVSENANEGTDTVRSSIDYTLTDNVENLELTGSTNLAATGNALANTLTGNSGDNVLSGQAGDDILIDNAGNDLLDGGLGADSMAAGIGDDTYIVDNAGDEVTELEGEGIDTVRASIDYTLGDNVENLELTGTADISGTGNILDNSISGNSGANRIDGAEGADTMAGGAGDDTYVVDNAADVVVEQANEGIDSVEAGISYTLTDNVENLILTGEENLDGTGNDLANALTGNAGENLLDGGRGIDTMAGGLGDDIYIVDETADVVVEHSGEGIDTVLASTDYTLSDNVEHLTLTGDADLAGTGNVLDNTITGNSGLNVLSGGAGNDSYIVDNTADVVMENVGEGTDTVFSSADYTLSENVENLTLTGVEDLAGTGNDLNNTILGNSGANFIDGAMGADAMAGGVGDDTYIVDNSGDRVTEGANAGTDLVYSSVSHTLSANVENLTLTGTAAINGTGNNLNNIIIGNTADNKLYGSSGNDTLLAGEGNDYLDGGSGADAMSGGTGNDTYIVDNSGDVITELAGEGIDIVYSSVSYTLAANVENLTLTGSSYINGTGNELDNVITGNTRNNTLSGLAGNDTLIGNSGNDTLDGGTGADTMSGGYGNDTYVVDDVGDLVSEAYGQGTDHVRSSIDYTLTDNVENLTLTGTADINGTGNNLNNVITGNTGSNVLDGQGGNDTLYGNTGDDILIGGDGNDRLYGQGGSDQLYGNAGSDILDGGIDGDTMAGGSGNDTYVVDNVGDIVTENVNEGTDLVQSSITYTLTDNVENLTLTGSAAINGTGNELDNVIRGNSAANILYGLAGNDTIYGNSGNDTLLGGEGNDYLDGGSGADAMSGGTGNDTYIVDNSGDVITELAGEGVDIVYSSVSHTLAANVENLTLTGSGYINGTGNELDNVIIGNTRNNTLSGLAGNDTLIGNSGNDTLDGGTGADSMIGGYGNDTYVVDDAGDAVTESYNAGTDHVRSSIDYTLTDNVENLTLTGTADINGTGNSLNNVITGNTGNNVLDGQAGNDTIYGNAGDDTLIGGDGNDSLYAGDGVDKLFGNAGNDLLDGGSGLDSMAGGTGDDTYIVDNTSDVIVENVAEGTDHVQSSATYTLSDNVENLTLTGTADIDGTGNDLDNVIKGNSGANVLDGQAGNDTIYGNGGNDTILGGAGNDYLDGGLGVDAMSGGSGDDVYIVDNMDDTVTELAGEGTDTVRASVSYTLSDNVENLTLTGSASISGIGNELDNVLTGNTGNNTLSGLAGDDTLIGNSGNDILDGGTGADTMSGGSGNDIYMVDDAGDVVSELSGQGTDHVHSSIDYTLTDNVENLTLTGTADLNGTGNNLGNVITGNAGNNVLDGGSGADTLIGGAGDDTYMIDNSADAIVELFDGGTDTVHSSASYILSENIENLYLTGTASINGTGNEVDNLIEGNSGNNTLSGQGGNDIIHGYEGDDLLYGGTGIDRLYGGAGNDTLDGGSGDDVMTGGTGDDVYVVDEAGDQVIENDGEGIDTVRASFDYVLGDNVENLVLTGTAAIDGTGDEFGNVLTGNDGDNVLSGLAGDDTLLGNGGNDTLIGGTGNDIMQGGSGNDTYLVDDAGDVVVEAAYAGIDSVRASLDYTLTDNVENLTLTGMADLKGTGNSLANVLTGNAGMNVLNGGAGADTMIGGDGDDTYVVDNVGDIVVEAAEQGIDTVLASASHTLEANVENLVLTGTASISGTGNELDNVLTGNSADNVLSGEGGDDLLDGGLGADTLVGGLGDDTYIVDDMNDSVVEAVDNGVDTVQAGVSFTLDANIENLILTGDGNTNATGNDLDNQITGNSGDNILAGGGGNDFLDGGDGADVLFGGAGNDIIHGGAGDDILQGESGDDRYIFLSGDGNDRIVAAQGQNTLYVGSGLSELDLKADRVGDDMVVQVYGTDDSFVLVDWYLQDGDGLNTMEFDDGTVLDRTGIEMLTNRPPEANPDYITAYEDGGPVVFSTSFLLANDTDPNPWDVLTVPSIGESEVGASVSLVNDEVTYDIGGGFQYLAQGEVLQDNFSYIVRDLKGATDIGNVLVDIVGVNDTPITEVDFDQVIEDDAIIAQGNVIANDYDIDIADVLSVVAPFEHTSDYGTLSLVSDGTYTYTLDNDSSVVQTMGRYHQITEHYDFAVTDGIEEVASSLEVTVSGTNDAPIVATPLADQQLIFHKPFCFQVPDGSFIDIDAGDALNYTATLEDGSALPDWLSFDSENLVFSGRAPKNVEYLDVKVTATDMVAATGSTEGSLSASDVFRVSVWHGNQGVGNGGDAPPWGLVYNFNDGVGTGPGDPGAKGGLRATQQHRVQERNLAHVDFSGDQLNAASDSIVPANESEFDSWQQPQKKEDYLNAGHWKKQKQQLPERNVAHPDTSAMFARWLAMDLAVSEALADRHVPSWLDERLGADTTVLCETQGALLGSKSMFGKDGFSLLPGNGQELKTFRGLDDGLRKIA